MKKVIVFLLASVVLAANFTALGQRPVRPAAAISSPEKAEYHEIGNPENEFAEKGLPEPSIIGLNPSEALARSLARDISKYDENSLPLLLATLQKAGFFIVDRDQKILFKPTSGPGMGMAFYDFEVAGMLKGSKYGAVTTVGKIAEVIYRNTNGVSANALGEIILRDLRSASRSEDPNVKFFATLIFELGKNFPTPVDLSTAAPADAKINFIQASLIERILLRDLLIGYEEFASSSMFRHPADLFNNGNGSVRFMTASFGRGDGGCGTIDDLALLKKIEKNTNKVVKIVTVYRELSRTWGVDPSKVKAPSGTILPDPIKGMLSSDAYKNFATGLSVVNAALSWAKLIMALSNVKLTVDVQDPMPLIRVKHTRKPGGEARVLTAKFNMDIAHTEILNCAGKALGTATGLSLSVPKGGPMKDKPVSWELLDIGDGPSKFTSNVVYLDSMKNADGTSSDVSKLSTDSNGESKISLTGMPQREDLEGQPVVPLPKKAVIRVSVATEKMNLKDDAQKIGGIFGVEVDPISIIAIVPEMLAKIKMSMYKVSVPVRDWQPCTEDWGGYIEYKRVREQTIVVKSATRSNGNHTGDGIRHISEIDEASITLNPRRPDEIKQKPPNQAVVFARGKHSDILEGIRDGDPCCGPKEGSYQTRFRDGKIMHYSKIMDIIALISFQGSERDFSLGFNFGVESISAKEREFHEITDSNCPLEYAEASDEEHDSIALVGGTLESGRYANRLSNTAGDILSGVKELPKAPDGSITTWKWELARCKQ